MHFRLDAIPVGDLFPSRGVIVGYHVPTDYHHSFVNLLFADGTCLTLSPKEHCLAPLFDCFTISIQKTTVAENNWTSIEPPFRIASIWELLRDEWLLPAPELEGMTIGNNPHLSYSGLPGEAPAECPASATLVSGVLLQSTDSRSMAVVASEKIPLVVDWMTDEAQIHLLLQSHQARPSGFMETP